MGHDFSTEITQDGSAIVVHVSGEIDMESCRRTILTISGLQDLLDADAAEHPSGSE